MTVLSYLNSRASGAVLTENEKSSINTSIVTLASRLNAYFNSPGDSLSGHFRFGSSVRGTILPRNIDPLSDIDYMVVFQKGGYIPQTYLDRLKRFIEQKYSTSEIYQSSPTVVLELNHIRFELVPALHSWSTTYQIPDGPSNWQYSDPTGFNKTLEEKNAAESYLMKPVIRLAKIWNTKAGYVFDSFLFEKWMCERYYPSGSNLQARLFTVFDNLMANEATQWRNDKIKRAKEIVANVRKYEADGMPYTAKAEIKKLIPE